MKASVAIQVLPATENDEELVRIVDEVIAYIKSTGLNCYVGPFETTIEGEDYDQLMDIMKECQHIAIRAGAPKVSAYIKVVYEPEGEILTIDKKVTKHHQA
ncbi:MAG: thiamine-binding protein [Clostridia bacterium]|nr:thiamine-binding protein [Clostridia bacterium]